MSGVGQLDAARRLRRTALVRPQVVAGGLAAAVAVGGLVLWLGRSADQIADLEGVQLFQDPRVTRLSDHCAAPSDVDAEGEAGAEVLARTGWQLQSVVVVANHGDSSPIQQWLGETPPMVWDCNPKPLPRHWGLNSRATFRVVGAEGAALDRSFNPELLPGHEGYPCAQGQLTGDGFYQMVTMGRRLADAYGSLLDRIIVSGGRAREDNLFFKSLDERRSLASTVGLLMALLSGPQPAAAFGDGDVVAIRVDSNASLVGDDSLPAQLAARAQRQEAWDLGAHLLARWCHHMHWPCSEAGGCVSLHEAAATVYRAEKEVAGCQAPRSSAASSASPEAASSSGLLVEVSRLLRRGDREAPALGILVADGRALASLLGALLGRGGVCGEPLRLRPPYAARLTLERWAPPVAAAPEEDAVRWRALLNGEDISAAMLGCVKHQGLEGCSVEPTALLGAHSGAA